MKSRLKQANCTCYMEESDIFQWPSSMQGFWKSLDICFNIVKFLFLKMYPKWTAKLLSKVASVSSNNYTTTWWGFVIWINFDTWYSLGCWWVALNLEINLGRTEISECLYSCILYLTFFKIPCSNSLLMYRNVICFCVLTVYNNKLGMFLNAQVEGIFQGQEVATKIVIWIVCTAKREKGNWSQENIELGILTIQKWSLGQNEHLQNQSIGRLVNKT